MQPSSPLPQAFVQELERLAPGARGFRFLVACSGGLDSTVLAHLCGEAGLRFSLAHMNYGLRGEDSESDAAFVARLARALEVPLLQAPGRLTGSEGVQEEARKLRYAWLEQERKAGGYHFVLTGHQADDNIETVLLHFFRGGGPLSLGGMPERTELALGLRPLLPFRREALENHALLNGITWREDRTNAEADYTRNALRLKVLPLLRTLYPGLDATLQRTAGRYRQIGALYGLGVEGLRKKLMRPHGGGWRVPVKELAAYGNEALVYELFRPFGFGSREAAGVAALLHSSTGRYMQSASHTVVRHRAWLVVSKKWKGAGPFPLELEMGDLEVPGGKLGWSVSAVPPQLAGPPETALIDARKLSWPLLLRTWKEGDYFYPLGMPKKKKVARYFIDRKLPKGEKERTWVLESGGRIVWVVGHRIDDRFKVSPSTKEVVRFSWSSHVAPDSTLPPQ